MRLLKVDSISEARKKLLDAASAKALKTEKVHFAKAMGRILAEDIKSEENIPGFRRSTVDGYAVRAADTGGVTESIPVFLDIIEAVEMGKAPTKEVGPGQATYVPTGGMVPEGADAMVMVEYCEAFDETSIAVYEPVSPGRNVVSIGEDIPEGRTFLCKGQYIRPQEAGVLSSAGVFEPSVYAPWKVTIISTGDELIGADEIPAEGQIRDINTYSLSAAAAKMGFEVIDTKVLRDNEALIEEAVKNAMEVSDLVVVSGGSSKGEKDHTAAVMDRLGEPGVFTHGIALKPGKPTILGYDKVSETIMIGLPGHPAAALMVFELMIGWLYRTLTGQKEPIAVAAEITENIAAAGGRATCQLVELIEDETCIGGYKAVPVFGKSGMMTTLTRADGYVMIDTNAEGLKEGGRVKVVLF